MNNLVLLAAGDAASRDGDRLYLEGLGYQVETADDGLECLAKLRRLVHPPRLLVLERDVVRDRADEVMAYLQETWNEASVPVILVTAPASPEEPVRPPSGSVVGCLQKPVRMSALLAFLIPVPEDAPDAVT